MKIWAISDTHCLHRQLTIPEGVDTLIVAGDFTNSRYTDKNLEELLDFKDWLNTLDKYGIYKIVVVAGNHDTYIERKEGHKILEEIGCDYLENNGITMQGLKIWGSPLTPTFGENWAFNRDRTKLDQYWKHIPDDTDILVTHGPPKGILDLSHNREGKLEYCGDKALLNKVLKLKPKYHIFGHIHNTFEDDINQGTRVYNGTTFINASCVTDGQFDKGPTSHGVVFEI